MRSAKACLPKVFIYANGDGEVVEKTKEKLKKLLLSKRLYNETNPDLIVCVGGDGTILRAAQDYINTLSEVSFVGVSSGTLGYMADYTPTELKDLLNDILQDNFSYRRNNLVKGELSGKSSQIIYGVNEIRIENPFHTLVMDVYIDDVFLEKYHGSGLNVCSSLGSSAYNRSLGGAIISEDVNLLQLTEIAAISNICFSSLESPIVLGQNQTITYRGSFDHCVIGFDHLSFSLGDVKTPVELRISLCSKEIIFARRKSLSGVDRLRKSFILS